MTSLRQTVIVRRANLLSLFLVALLPPTIGVSHVERPSR